MTERKAQIQQFNILRGALHDLLTQAFESGQYHTREKLDANPESYAARVLSELDREEQ